LIFVSRGTTEAIEETEGEATVAAEGMEEKGGGGNDRAEKGEGEEGT
jgi:hypothetical protein